MNRIRAQFWWPRVLWLSDGYESFTMLRLWAWWESVCAETVGGLVRDIQSLGTSVQCIVG